MENNFEDLESENNEFIFPEEWKLGTFIDVMGTDGIFVDGDWVESKDQDPNGEVRLIQLADIGDGIFKNKSQRFLTRQRAGELDCTFLSQGDLLISRLGDPLGKCCIFPGDPKPSITAVDICIVRPGNFKADPKWLMYVINSPEIRKRINHFKRGTTRARISRKNLGTLPIPLPPLAEQQCIVARIEALLKEVNAARNRLSRVPLIIKKFRQSVLASACSGRLTEGWREENPDVEQADRLLERIQELKNYSDPNKSKNKKKIAPLNFKEDNELDSDIVVDLPPTWTISNLGNITSRITSGSRWWKKYYCNDGPGTFILSQNVRPFVLNWSTVLHVDPLENDPDRKRSEVQKDDLLITIAGNTGDVCRVRDDLDQYYVCQSVAMVRLVLKEISPYIEVYLNSPSHGQKQYDDWAYGEGRPHLSFNQLKKTTILLPPLAEQNEIISRVNALFERADAIEREVEAATKRTEALTQAVLGKAFRGDLVPTGIAEGKA